MRSVASGTIDLSESFGLRVPVTLVARLGKRPGGLTISK